MRTFIMCAKCGALKLEDPETEDIFWKVLTPLELVVIAAIPRSHALTMIYGASEVHHELCHDCCIVKPPSLN